jgi:hypothetical protein
VTHDSDRGSLGKVGARILIPKGSIVLKRLGTSRPDSYLVKKKPLDEPIGLVVSPNFDRIQKYLHRVGVEFNLTA